MSTLPAQSHGLEIDMQRAVRHHQCMRSLAELYRGWGYAPYSLPLIDRYEGYSDALRSDDLQRSFRFVDNDGRLVLLRPDLTLFLARHVAHTLRPDHLPLRLWYNDSVLRNNPRITGEKIEQYQSGVELIGQPDEEAEIELLLLLHQALSALGLGDSVIHIGSRRLLMAVLGGSGGAGEAAAHAKRGEIIAAVINRRARAVAALFEEWNYGVGRARRLAELFMYIGDARQSIPARLLDDEGEVGGEVLRLQRIARGAAELGVGDIRINLSEIGDQYYYTGATFSAYHPHYADKIASGGRYDTLFGAYGFDTSSAGFTILLHRLEDETTLGQCAPFAMPAPPAVSAAGGATFAERYDNAKRRRAAGEAVSL